MRAAASTIASMLPMAASRARWPITASRTGRGGRAAPALLKCRTLATPGVSDLSNGTSSVMMAAPSSQRVWADDFPAVALEEFVAFVVVGRAALRERLDVAAGGGRGVEKEDAAGFAAGVLPGMRHVAREERAGAGPADGNLVADLKGDLAGEHPGDLVAVAVQMEEALGAGRHGFLEQH